MNIADSCKELGGRWKDGRLEGDAQQQRGGGLVEASKS